MSEQLSTMTALLRRTANDYGGRLYLSRQTTDIVLSNLQFLANDVARYERSIRGSDVDSPAVLAIIRALVAANAMREKENGECGDLRGNDKVD
ncbi:hypothetical protein [Thalassospira sp. MCCC 1A03138]|uniref:hypothetical protein n=1 Tax=Thalassospira sp. MCCC 1A03138 TaxID=1470576 RepID=UPI001AEFA1A4|nr:hypothetical protein [Thalassospira sp. MCCC 1A03138]